MDGLSHSGVAESQGVAVGQVGGAFLPCLHFSSLKKEELTVLPFSSQTLPGHICQRCAPTIPEVGWIRRLTLWGDKKMAWRPSIVARENGLESAEYERVRPPFPPSLPSSFLA
jgi:hypothetical protein